MENSMCIVFAKACYPIKTSENGKTYDHKNAIKGTLRTNLLHYFDFITTMCKKVDWDKRRDFGKEKLFQHTCICQQWRIFPSHYDFLNASDKKTKLTA